jgi:hypothetical protein
MARKDYVWDAESAKQIEAQELDKYYGANEDHYRGLAEGVWESLKRISADSSYLKPDDLTDALQPIIDRDSVTLTGMAARGLPEPHGRLGPQWYSWFTHYIVERFFEWFEAERQRKGGTPE